ncbi:MAG: hypothetical protein J1E63_01270 [Muribaculaceae bacterium]|nr:hypothetical protein [Muribaculaceae bacterium]
MSQGFTPRETRGLIILLVLLAVIAALMVLGQRRAVRPSLPERTPADTAIVVANPAPADSIARKSGRKQRKKSASKTEKKSKPQPQPRQERNFLDEPVNKP